MVDVIPEIRATEAPRLLAYSGRVERTRPLEMSARKTTT